MGRHSKDWNEGYQAAIEAIKKSLQNNSGGNIGNGNDLESIPNVGDQQQNTNNNSRTNPNDSNQGIVRPEDCESNNSVVQNTPGTPGGFFDKKEGDKLAKEEGYSEEGGTDETVEREWKDSALRAANAINDKPGTAFGNLKDKILGLYKPTTDWKKALQYVVGKSINTQDKRQAYANKNILVSQDRIARTEKDKYDTTDYIVAMIDTSGSMTNDLLKRCLSEVYYMALMKKPIKLYIVQCDTKIQEIKEYKSLKELKQEINVATVKGGGGTNFKPFFDLFEKDKRFSTKRPDLCIIFTDGYVEQIPRNKRKMNWLCWCIIDRPSWVTTYNDTMTKVIHLKSSDIK